MKKMMSFLMAGMLVLGLSYQAEATVGVKANYSEDGNVKFYIPSIMDGNKKIINKLNADFKDSVLTKVKDFKAIISEDSRPNIKDKTSFASNYTVKYNKNDILSITETGYQYTGGAHGITWRSSKTIYLPTGQVYDLSEIFKEGFDYQTFLNPKINQQIKERGLEKDLTFEGVNKDTSYFITEEGLVIYYQPYEIAAYVFGMPEFFIPINEVRDNLQDNIKIFKI